MNATCLDSFDHDCLLDGNDLLDVCNRKPRLCIAWRMHLGMSRGRARVVSEKVLAAVVHTVLLAIAAR